MESLRRVCLPTLVSKWLDFEVFSNTEGPYTRRPISQPFFENNRGTLRTHTLFAKIRARSSRCCGLVSWPAWSDISKKACGV